MIPLILRVTTLKGSFALDARLKESHRVTPTEKRYRQNLALERAFKDRVKMAVRTHKEGVLKYKDQCSQAEALIAQLRLQLEASQI